MIDCEDSGEHPEGYEEALAECTVLAAKLLKLALEDRSD